MGDAGPAGLDKCGETCRGRGVGANLHLEDARTGAMKPEWRVRHEIAYQPANQVAQGEKYLGFVGLHHTGASTVALDHDVTTREVVGILAEDAVHDGAQVRRLWH